MVPGLSAGAGVKKKAKKALLFLKKKHSFTFALLFKYVCFFKQTRK